MSRIISIMPVYKGRKQYGWNVIYYSGPPMKHTRDVVRTVGRNGRTLKHPVKETEVRYSAGVVSRIIRRRKSLRKLGVRI